MKTVLALLSALMLIGAQTVAMARPATVIAPARVASGCHCGRACCSASQAGGQSSAPAAPAPAGFQFQPLTLASGSPVWVLPVVPARDVSPSQTSSPTDSGAPLFARLCVFLI